MLIPFVKAYLTTKKLKGVKKNQTVCIFVSHFSIFYPILMVRASN